MTDEVTGVELAIVLVAVVIGAISKAVTGMGMPVIVIPVAALFVDIGDAVVVIALPNLFANAVLVVREREHVHETRDLPALAITGGIGAVIGTLLFVNVPDEPLVIALIIAIVVYITTFFLRPDLRTSPEQSRRLSPFAGLLAGTFQGAIGISGPVVGSWIHSFRLPRGAHIFSVTLLFLVAGSAQLVVLVVSGELGGRIVATLLACIPVLAVIPMGTRLRDRISGRGFDLAIVGMLALSSIALCVRTFA
ncbi:sulfite exporter TauE/SafE family protein [uncultured Ilumatobacter sp.]|uniref:sulfite exporter TauE/SafE family protein n=1 Tax=uncultured Ilumatobacter sp. TaxID=879968 RepID=UPI00374EB389